MSTDKLNYIIKVSRRMKLDLVHHNEFGFGTSLGWIVRRTAFLRLLNLH
jgi:hypothetical protein